MISQDKTQIYLPFATLNRMHDLRAFVIGSGNDVIIPSNTYNVTALAVSDTCANLIFADADIHMMNASNLEKVKTRKGEPGNGYVFKLRTPLSAWKGALCRSRARIV